MQLKQDHRFVCLSDIDVPGVETRPLQDNLPGWWSKMEVFREFNHATYLDLDTVLVGDSSYALFAEHRFTLLRGLHLKKNGGINTSIMCFRGDYRFLYDAFMADKERIMEEYVKNDRWGDQGFVRDAARGRIDFSIFQFRFPGLAVRYSKDLQDKEALEARERSWATRRALRLGRDWMREPRIVLFNSAVKPWHADEPWIPKLEAA